MHDDRKTEILKAFMKLVSRFGLSEKDAIMLVDKYTDRQQ